MFIDVSPSRLLRTTRRNSKLTQTELADRLGTTQPVIARLERSDANPTLATLERALEAAGYQLELRAIPRAHPAVDETQIVERLRWTPAERLAAAATASRNIAALVSHAKRSDHAAT